MTSLELWRNIMVGLFVVFMPWAVIGGLIITIGINLAGDIRRGFPAFLVVLVSILLAASLCIGWMVNMAKPCGFLDRHFPIQEHISGHCDPVRTTG